MTNQDKITNIKISQNLTWLLKGQHMGRVHSIFEHGFNLLFDEGIIYIGGSLEQPLSPLAVLIDEAIFYQVKKDLEIDNIVKLYDSKWFFYTRRPQVIHSGKVQSYDLSLSGIKLLESIYLKKHLDELYPYQKSGFKRVEPINQVYSDIAATKEIKDSHIYNLIGAGIGLTPSGDDFLQGLILAEALTGYSNEYKKRIARYLKQRKTTDVSTSYYKAIFNDLVSQTWLEAIEAANTKNPKLPVLLKRLQAFGKTSGSDSLLGVQTYLTIYS